MGRGAHGQPSTPVSRRTGGWDQIAVNRHLAGATSFRYPSVLRRPSAPGADRGALPLESRTPHFRSQRIAEVTRALIPDLREGRARIRGLSNDADRLWLPQMRTRPSSSCASIDSVPHRGDLFRLGPHLPAGESRSYVVTATRWEVAATSPISSYSSGALATCGALTPARTGPHRICCLRRNSTGSKLSVPRMVGGRNLA